MDTVLSTCAPRYKGFVVLLIHTIVRPSREKLSLALEPRPCAYRIPLTLPPSLPPSLSLSTSHHPFYFIPNLLLKS